MKMKKVRAALAGRTFLFVFTVKVRATGNCSAVLCYLGIKLFAYITRYNGL